MELGDEDATYRGNIALRTIIIRHYYKAGEHTSVMYVKWY